MSIWTAIRDNFIKPTLDPFNITGIRTKKPETPNLPPDPALAIAEEKKKNLRKSSQPRGRASTILSQGNDLSASSSLLGE